MCPPVLVRALYAIWADTQVRPYTNHIKTKISAIRRCSTSICKDARSCRAGGHPLCPLAVGFWPLALGWCYCAPTASVPIRGRRVTLCRGGPMCPPVLVRALYAMWADTQVRPYTNHINTRSSAIRRCSTSICRDAREYLVGGRALCPLAVGFWPLALGWCYCAPTGCHHG